MSMSVSQVKSSQTIIDDIQAEYLGQSYFLKYQAEKSLLGTAELPIANSLLLDEQSFEASGTESPTFNPQVNAIRINISY